MTTSQRTIARVRRRLVLQRGLRLAGWVLLGLAGVSAVGLVAAQAVGFVVPGPWFAWAGGGALGVALGVGLVAARLAQPGAESVAVRVDDALGLKDTLGTALYAETLDAAGTGGAVAQRVRDDAEAAAGKVASGRLREAFPVLPTRVWGWALGVVAAVAVLALDPLGLVERATGRHADAAVAQASAQAAREALEEAQQTAEQLAADTPEAEAEDGAPLEELDAEALSDRLAAMLSQRDLTNPEDRREAAAQVSDLHDLAAEQAQAREQEVQALENLMSGVDAGESGPASDFAQAMRRSDFAQARQELAKMGDALKNGSLSDAQQQQLAQQLDTMAQQLEERAAQQQQEAAAAKQAAEQALQDAGLSEQQVQDLAERARDAQAVQEQLAKANPPQSPQEEKDQQDQAQELAQQQRDAAGQEKRGEQAGERGQQMAQQMKQMSEALKDEPPQESESDSASESAQAKEGQGQEGAEEQVAQAAEPGEGGEQGGQVEQGQQGEAGEQAASDGPGGEQGAPSAQQTAQKTPQQKQQQLSEAMQQMQEQLGQSEQQQQQAQGTKSAAEQLQQAMQQMSGPPGSPGSQGKPSASPTAGGGAQGGGGGGIGEGSASVGGVLGDERPALGSGSHVSKDIQDGQGGRVLSSWTEGGEMTPGEAKLEFDAAVTQAQAQAERAVSDDRTPQRYHNAIRDYFRNLPEAPPSE